MENSTLQGPVSVSVDASGWHHYSGGLFTGPCEDSLPHHAVLAVGYGTDDNGVKYWLIKNSWGTKWGMDGFFQIERDVNMCGIAQCNSYPESVAEINSNNFIKVTPNMPEPEIQFLNQ